MSYTDYLIALAPAWLRGKWGVRYLSVIGNTMDALVDAATEAVKARLVSTCPEDALPYHANDRQLEQIPGESTASFRLRLQKAFSAWVLAGTGKGIVEAIKLLGLTNVVHLEARTFRWDDQGDQDWWRFWVLIDQPHPFGTTFPDGAWDDPGTWSDGGFWDGFTGEMLALYELIRRMIRKWKAAHTIGVSLIVILNGEIWDWPEGTWDDPGTWDAEVLYLTI